MLFLQLFVFILWLRESQICWCHKTAFSFSLSPTFHSGNLAQMKINCNYMSLSTFITRIGHKNKNTLYTRHAPEITSRRNVPSVNQCGNQSINWTRSRSMHFLLPNKHFRWIQSKAPQIAHTNWWVCVCVCVTYILQYISHYTYVYTYYGWAYVFRLNAALSLIYYCVFVVA